MGSKCNEWRIVVERETEFQERERERERESEHLYTQVVLVLPLHCTPLHCTAPLLFLQWHDSSTSIRLYTTTIDKS
jgi:hypothetical protein